MNYTPRGATRDDFPLEKLFCDLFSTQNVIYEARKTFTTPLGFTHSVDLQKCSLDDHFPTKKIDVSTRILPVFYYFGALDF